MQSTKASFLAGFISIVVPSAMASAKAMMAWIRHFKIGTVALAGRLAVPYIPLPGAVLGGVYLSKAAPAAA